MRSGGVVIRQTLGELCVTADARATVDNNDQVVIYGDGSTKWSRN